MATKKEKGRYIALREFPASDGTPVAAGDTVDLAEEDAALLIRDGMIREA